MNIFNRVANKLTDRFRGTKQKATNLCDLLDIAEGGVPGHLNRLRVRIAKEIRQTSDIPNGYEDERELWALLIKRYSEISGEADLMKRLVQLQESPVFVTLLETFLRNIYYHLLEQKSYKAIDSLQKQIKPSTWATVLERLPQHQQKLWREPDNGHFVKPPKKVVRLADEFETAANKYMIQEWQMHKCSLCGYKCGFLFDLKLNVVCYDNGCDCVLIRPPPRKRSWKDVADHYNLQDDDKVIANMNKFWHFDQDEKSVLDQNVSKDVAPGIAANKCNKRIPHLQITRYLQKIDKKALSRLSYLVKGVYTDPSRAPEPSNLSDLVMIMRHGRGGSGGRLWLSERGTPMQWYMDSHIYTSLQKSQRHWSRNFQRRTQKYRQLIPRLEFEISQWKEAIEHAHWTCGLSPCSIAGWMEKAMRFCPSLTKKQVAFKAWEVYLRFYFDIWGCQTPKSLAQTIIQLLLKVDTKTLERVLKLLPTEQEAFWHEQVSWAQVVQSNPVVSVKITLTDYGDNCDWDISVLKRAKECKMKSKPELLRSGRSSSVGWARQDSANALKQLVQVVPDCQMEFSLIKKRDNDEFQSLKYSNSSRHGHMHDVAHSFMKSLGWF